MDLIDPRREVVEVAAQGVQTVYVVEPVFVTFAGPTIEAFNALVAQVIALTARVTALENAGPVLPGPTLFPSPMLYPEAG